jgi:hypothetical protein
MTMDDREGFLRRDGALIGVATAGLINGSHTSPWFDLVAGPIAAILSGFYISSPVLLFYFASLMISVFTVLVAGVPAAMYEQRNGLTDSNARSMMIWLVSAVALAAPALLKMIGVW